MKKRNCSKIEEVKQIEWATKERKEEKETPEVKPKVMLRLISDGQGGFFPIKPEEGKEEQQVPPGQTTNAPTTTMPYRNKPETRHE